jgi:hypothetical protein
VHRIWCWRCGRANAAIPAWHRGERGRKGTRVSAANGLPLRVPCERPKCPSCPCPACPVYPLALCSATPELLSVPEDPPSQLPPPTPGPPDPPDPDRRALLQKLALTRPTAHLFLFSAPSASRVTTLSCFIVGVLA